MPRALLLLPKSCCLWTPSLAFLAFLASSGQGRLASAADNATIADEKATVTVDASSASDEIFSDMGPARRVVVTNQAMGARSAVAADLDGDGLPDLVAASSNDNAVSWYRNLGVSLSPPVLQFSVKNEITWNSRGSRIAVVADVNGDGHVDVINVAFYERQLRWFENDGAGTFTPHTISDGVIEGQGVTAADVDRDGQVDVVVASSGDNTIAVFRNVDHGVFCEVKEVVDDQAIGARTVVAADLDGDGWIDLASASKDDDTVAWYPNSGAGHFPEKRIVSRGAESTGAYSLVAKDVDRDGDVDLVVASNGNDHVSLWRNDGSGNFTKTLIYDNADFVLSVTAVDFDLDGDVDIASASFFDGHINWYENVDGLGYEWKNHTIYVGLQGHYVSHADMDGDGDDDLIAVTSAENTVAVFLASTECDGAADPISCCHTGTEWNGTACDACKPGTYGIGSGAEAVCVECPADACTVPGLDTVPPTCAGRTGCPDPAAGAALCICSENAVLDKSTGICVTCPPWKSRPHTDIVRELDTMGNYSLWEEQQGVCEVAEGVPILAMVIPVVLFVVALVAFLLYSRGKKKMIEEQQFTIDSQRKVIKALKQEDDDLPDRSKFGDAVAFVDDMLESDSVLRDPDQVEKLTLVRQCLLGTDRAENHVPVSLEQNLRNPMTERQSLFILSEFAGVKSTPAIRRTFVQRTRSSALLSFHTESERDFSESADESIYCLPEFQMLNLAQKERMFKLLSFSNLKRWNFNIFDVSAIDEENTLLFVAWAVICSPHAQIAMAIALGEDFNNANSPIREGYKFAGRCVKMDEKILCDYVRAIQKDYRLENRYHNRIHAGDVVQTLNSLIQMVDQTLMNGEEVFSALLAAVVHDVKHPGSNNHYQNRSMSPLALAHNDVSPLESEHVSHAFKVMLTSRGKGAVDNGAECDDYNFLRYEDPDQFQQIRKRVIDAVLHTDMAKHFSTVDKMKSLVGGKKWEDIERDMQWEVLMFMLHLADISNPAKVHPMCVLWTDRCLDEFFYQGDKERDMGFPISPNCDRNSTSRPDSQIGFINFVVKPAYAVLADVLPRVGEEVMPIFESNLKYWGEEKAKPDEQAVTT